MSHPMIASAADDIRIWQLNDEAKNGNIQTKPLKQFSPHHAPKISCLSWNHNNQVLISGASDGNIALSHVSGSVLGSLSAPRSDVVDEISCVCLSSGSRYLCSGGTARRARVWDLKEKEMIKEFKSHTDTITCIQFNHSDVHVASGSLSGDVLVHSLLSAQTVSTMRAPIVQPIRAIQYSPHHKTRLVSVGDHGRVVLWETSERAMLADFHSHTGAAYGVAFSPINKLLLASAGMDKQLLFYDCNDKKVIKSIDAEAALTGLSFFEDGVTVATGTVNGSVLVYDLRRGSTPMYKFEAHPGCQVSAVAFQRSKVSGLKSSSRKSAAEGKASSSPAAEAAPEESPAPAKSAPPAEPKAASLVSFPSEPEAPPQQPSQMEDKAPASQDPATPSTPALSTRGGTTSQAKIQQLLNNIDSATKTKRPSEQTPMATPSSPPKETPNPLYGEPSPSQSNAAIRVEPSPALPRAQQDMPSIPNAYQVFEDMYAKGPLEGDVGTVEWQAKFVRTSLEDCLEEMRLQVHGDLQNMHLELLRQFQIQQTEIQAQLQSFACGQQRMVEEVEELRAENRRLKGLQEHGVPE